MWSYNIFVLHTCLYYCSLFILSYKMMMMMMTKKIFLNLQSVEIILNGILYRIFRAELALDSVKTTSLWQTCYVCHKQNQFNTDDDLRYCSYTNSKPAIRITISYSNKPVRMCPTRDYQSFVDVLCTNSPETPTLDCISFHTVWYVYCMPIGATWPMW